MSKDPAFLFYSKDWLTGTADLMPEEKGVYIDLLAHQQQHGILPKDTERLARMVALSHDEFLKIWGKIEDNFIHMNGGLINLKLYQLIQERKKGAKKKRISGAFATYLRKNHLDKETYNAIKKDFSVDLFLEFTDDAITDEVTFWCTKWLSRWSPSA
jgi:uncharacterized protein YdaU (DUF1376 family)